MNTNLCIIKSLSLRATEQLMEGTMQIVFLSPKTRHYPFNNTAILVAVKVILLHLCTMRKQNFLW
jgi:hypothetical protein